MRKSIIHATGGAAAIVIISTFWISTLVSELLLDNSAVVVVKHAIVNYGLAPLIIVMAIVGGSGNLLANGRSGGLVGAKKRRMPILVANAVLVMIPSAFFLNYKASSGQFDSWFYVVQVAELAVGLVQLSILRLNFRDGLIMTGRMRLKPKPTKKS